MLSGLNVVFSWMSPSRRRMEKTTIGTAKAHPTWVNRTPKGTFSPEGYPLYHYQTYILEDFIEGWQSS